jgi:hypothetical protein
MAKGANGFVTDLPEIAGCWFCQLLSNQIACYRCALKNSGTKFYLVQAFRNDIENMLNS